MSSTLFKRILFAVFVFIASYSYTQNCNIISKANDIIPDGLCAPVTVSWEVTYRGVNDAGTPVEIQFDWDDGNVETIAATNTNIALQEWQVVATHVYPPGGPQCTYNPTATLMVNGVLCTSSMQEQTVTVWDTDDENGGDVAIDPTVYPICVGNTDCTVFNDISLFNCVPPVENDNPNTPTRWTQWVYGTTYTINNVTVGGTVQTYPYYGAVVPLPGPVTGPGAPNNVSLSCCAPASALVGEFFEVTLRNWNYCNPYDDPTIPGPPADLINGDYPPVETTAMILIVPYPDATINPQGPFCENDPSVTFSAATPGGTWSGNGITPGGNFNPSNAGPGVHTITYSVTDANGCTGIDTYDVTVWAIPDPNILPSPNSEVCPGDALLLDGNPTPGDGNIITHQWTGNTGPLNFTNIQAPTFLTSTQGVYSMTYTVTDDNGCSASENVTVTVNPVVASIIPDPAETCVDGDLALNGNPSGGTGNYVSHVWTGDIAYLNNANIQNPIFNSSMLGTYNLTYTVIDDNGCTDTDNITVTVYENPVADAGQDSSLCGPTIDFYATPSIGTGTWTQDVGPGSSVFSNANSPTSAVTVDTYGTYDFIWTEVFGASCTDRDTITITFFEQPVADPGIWDSICGLSYDLNANPSVGLGTWTLVSGPGTVGFSNANSPTSNVTVSAYGAYEFMWTEDNGVCSDSNNVTISFDLVPTPGFLPIDTSGCPPFNLTFTNTTVGGTSYSWDMGDGGVSTDVNPNYTYYNSTTSDITYTVIMTAESTYGCQSTIQHDLVVHPIPDSDFTHDGVPACSPNTVNFTNTSSGSVMHIWDFGDGNPLDTVDNTTHTFINDTILIQYYSVDLMAVSNYGCIDTSSQFITVYPNPHNDFQVTPDTACHPATVMFIADPGGATYNWDYGDGVSEIGSSIISHTYSNVSGQDTTYNVTLITTSVFGCVDTSMKPVVVYPNPEANFTLSSTTGCSPMEVIITNSSTGATTYFWDYGDGTTNTSGSPSLSHTYNNPNATPVTFYPELLVENNYGCKDSLTLSIVVYPNINSDFISDTVGCTPLTILFDNLSDGASSYMWDFGDGILSSDNEPTHTYTNTGTAEIINNVSLIATSVYGCQDTAYSQITVYPVPYADFSFTNTSGCSPFTAVINNASTGATLNNWDFGDGTTGTQPDISFMHEYTNIQSNPVNYTVELTVENLYGCEDVTSQIVTVYPEVIANFVCDTAGCTPFVVDFTNQTMGAASYDWNFGDGGTSVNINPNHTYINSTSVDLTYNVFLTASSAYGCTDNASAQIVVYPVPVAGFVATPPTQLFNGDSSLVTMANTSTPGTWEYWWDFGDNSFDSIYNPSHYYHTWGDFDISLVVYSDHCSDTAIQTIHITQPEPQAYFTGSAVGCAPLDVEFENESLYGDSYLWVFGDGSTSTAFSPIHTFNAPGTYNVKLVVTNVNGVDSVFGGNIKVYQNPTAYFSAAPSVVFIPDQPVKCTNLSQYATSFYWEFGDGGTSQEENPIHFYEEEGAFDIKLTAKTEHNCIDTFSIPRAVVAESNGKLEMPNAFTPDPSGPSGGVYAIGGYNNDIFHPLHVGVDPDQYSLMIFNRWGELIFESKDPMVGWDGYYRGKLCKQDVYVWKIKGKFMNGESFIKAGDVTLLH